MAGAIPGKGRQFPPATGPPQPTHLTGSQPEASNSDAMQNGYHSRDQSAHRGRNPVPPNAGPYVNQQQQGGQITSPRSQSTNVASRMPALERRPSAMHGHARQPSRPQGVYQHSRNPSFASSPNNSPLSPQLTGSVPLNGGPTPEYPSLTMLHHAPSAVASANSPSSFSNTSNAAFAPSTTIAMLGSADNSNMMFTQKKIERSQSSKPRRGHNHHRSHSRNQHQFEQKTVGEFALHHLFASFVGQADSKINHCILHEPETDYRVEDVCGPGVDPDFDQLISALGHISGQKPKPLIDTIMLWRKGKSEAASNAQGELSQVKSPQSTQKTVPRRNTELTHMLDSNPQSMENSNYSEVMSLREIAAQAERRSALSIYLLCRVLIEVYNQTDLTSLTLEMADRLEDIIFGQLKIMEPDQLAASSFRAANWRIFCQLLGAMSRLRLKTVSVRFTAELWFYQKEMNVKGPVPREIEGKARLLIIAAKHLRVRSQPDNVWKDSCDLLYALGELFMASHGQPIKHAYCQTLEDLILPIAEQGGSQISNLKWKDFLSMTNSRLGQMLAKPRHWATAFRLSSALLCASPIETFAPQWLSTVSSLQAKLKDRLTRASALQSICRLVWIYLDRIPEQPTVVLRKLEDVMKIVLPSGKKNHLSTDPAFAEPVIELIRIIGSRYHEFCFKVIIFPLINSDLFAFGKDTKVEQLEPEKMVIGIRAFLSIIADLEKTLNKRPGLPRFHPSGSVADSSAEFPYNQLGDHGRPRMVAGSRDSQLSRPVEISSLDEVTKEYHSRFCEILGKITLICDDTFGGQATLDEKFGVLTPKTPVSDAFSFARKDDQPGLLEHRQGFYELFHVAVRALPRCLSSHVPFKSLINLLCTGTAHVQSAIAVSSAQSLKSIARQAHAQPVTIGFARFIFNFDARYSTMSDEGMLGPDHIENTLRLYVELLQIWIEEIKKKIRGSVTNTAEEPLSAHRDLPLDLTSVTGLVEEVESHGAFFLCSQSRRVRSFAVRVLGLVTEFDKALGRDHPRIIQILEGDPQRVMDPSDDQLSVAERSRLQKGKRRSASQSTLIELCSSEVSYDSTLWSKIFPNLVRLSFEMCPFAVTVGRNIVCARLLQMHKSISDLATNSRGPPAPGVDHPHARMLNRMGGTPAEVIIEQWRLYLVMACTTMTNAGAQTQSQLANMQHARKISKSAQQGQEKMSSARALFASIIPLLSAAPTSIRDAIVVALGSINNNLYRTLLESLQYAVTTCNEEAKQRTGTHQRSGSNPQRSDKTDRLRTEVTHVYRLTARFLHDPKLLQDEWIMTNITIYTRDLMLFLSDAEIQSDWRFQSLRRQYCGLLEEFFDAINRSPEPSRWMAFESRKSAFALMEDWCGYSPNQTRIDQREEQMKQSALSQHQDTGEKTNITASMEIEKRNLRTAALSSMASLCAGPIQIPTQQGGRLSFDVRRMLTWIDQIFGTANDKIHLIGRRALYNLIIHNRDYPYLLETSIEKCYSADRPRALESYFEVVTRVLMEQSDYPVAFWRILGAVLFTLGNEKSQIRMKSARLLRTMEQRRQRNSKLQDFDISISDRTTAVYKLAQFEISKRLSRQHTELAFFVFSQFSNHFKNILPDNQRNMVAAILPWVQTIDLQLEPGGHPTAQSYMLLANLLEITTKASGTLHNEVQALWQALATGPHGGNVQVVLDFVISLCLDRKEQSFVDYAKHIVVYLSSTAAGQKVIEFLLLQIGPKNMVPEKRDPVVLPPNSLGLPYVADLSQALPIGNRQSGFSLGQLSLIFLVDLMVAPVKLSKESVPLLLQSIIVLWDHYTLLIQEHAREMLVHLIHELIITKIEDNATTPNKESIEGFVESIRQHDAAVIWSYDECNGKDGDEESDRVPTSMVQVTRQVIDLFSIEYPNIHEQWARLTLSWATSCPVKHIACRSFQVFRCILSSLDLSMLADMLARLSNTVADEEPDFQTFALEILTTLKTIITALEPSDLLTYPQLFWATCACLNTRNEREFLETLSMLSNFLGKVDLSDPAVVKLLIEAKPDRWQGQFDGIAPLVYKGIKSATSLEKSLRVLDKIVTLPENDLVGNRTRLLFGILGHLPGFLNSFSEIGRHTETISSARTLSNVAESQNNQEISLVLTAFANGQYTASNDFLTQILSTLRQTFFPTWELKCLIFLIGLLTNRHSWFKLRTLEILCTMIPDIDTRRPEITSHGPDLISPLLRLLQTEFCPQALEVMDHIMIMSATPMDNAHMRMSMASSSSRSMRKEYERMKSLYGIPEDTGWSIPMPAVLSNTTRANMQAVFFTCATADATTQEPAATPEVEFAEEEHDSYFSFEGTSTTGPDDSGIDLNEDDIGGDLVSKLDALDDFFDDDSGDARLSTLTVTPYNAFSGIEADLYDQQTAPLLYKSLWRYGSVSSLHSGFTERGISSREPVLTRPAPINSFMPSTAPPIRPSMHSRSVTTPANNPGKLHGIDLSDDSTDEPFSEDERSTGFGTSRPSGPAVRSKHNHTRTLGSGQAGKEYRQRDLLRGQGRSHAQGPNSPEVPKVPDSYLQENRRPHDA